MRCLRYSSPPCTELTPTPCDPQTAFAPAGMALLMANGKAVPGSPEYWLKTGGLMPGLPLASIGEVS